MGKKQDPISKKRAGGMAQLVACLSHNHEAPSSNTRKKRKKKRYFFFFLYLEAGKINSK
jgi:hypothetical protein